MNRWRITLHQWTGGCEQLRHPTIKLTMDTCGHVLTKLQRQVADTMDGLFGAAAG
jgi:hypothetical protein